MTDPSDVTLEAIKLRMRTALERRPLKWLEERTGESYQNIVRWVSQDTQPPPHFYVAVARATGYSIEWIMTGDGPKKPARPEKLERAFFEMAAIVDRIRKGEPVEATSTNEASGAESAAGLKKGEATQAVESLREPRTNQKRKRHQK